jgi:NAD(P)-dependent dehydrogenase (short-subunit alcohol dehydrogenase family)
MARLQNKIALITGGNSGIGLATAKLFSQEGAQVIISGRDQATLDSASQQIGHGVLALQSDVADLAALDRLFTQIKQKFGHLDVVFANAGVFLGGSLAEVTEEVYDQQFDINVKGVFFTIQKAVPLLREGASIVINATALIHSGMLGASLYSATKAAVRQLARNLSNELAGQNIRVNVVSPGYIRTPIIARTGANEEQVKGFYDHASGEVPHRRPGTAEELAQAVLFLASSESSYVVGQELVVDGGYSAIGAPGVAR